MLMCRNGFTLAELLIALAILGVIAVFTIPKVLQSQQSSASNAVAKEALGTLSAAFSAYQLNNSLSASTKSADLTPYLNYVKMGTTTVLDHVGGTPYGANDTCSNSKPCFQLHNGAMLMMYDTNFCNTSNISFIHFILDPDGKFSGAANSTAPGVSMGVDLHYNGKINSAGTRNAGTDCTYQGGGNQFWGTVPDPTWFSWN